MGTMDKLDLKQSNLVLEGTPQEQSEWNKKIQDRLEVLSPDRDKRKRIYRIRKDFYTGDQSTYTTIIGLTVKEKKGHANAVMNYAGKTSAKIGYALANNPPKLTVPARKVQSEVRAIEADRAQGVEDFIDTVFTNNRFWKGGYRRSSFNQVVNADFAIKLYPYNSGTKDEPVWEFKVINHERMENLLVGWRGDDPTQFDYVIVDEMRSIQSIKDEYGIVVPESLATTASDQKDASGNSSHNNNNQWGTKGPNSAARVSLPDGQSNVPTIRFIEYDDENVYALKIGTQIVQLIFKDGKTFPKMKFWRIGHNIPNPGSPWSISDIDYLVDPQTELNEASNEERDYIRVGANQKYVAYNMTDFNPESIRTGSGGVIFVNSPDGTARFEPLQTNVNSFPIDSYLSRVQNHLHDLGLPKVSYGASGADSGRSKAIDYQTMVDLVVFKRDAWELVLDEVCELIQIMGNFFFPELNIFKDPQTGGFVVRHVEFDWTDILPVTQADKVVNVINKVQMGLPFKEAYKELGYRDVDAIISAMKEEARDPELMEFRSKMWQLTAGILAAQQNAMAVNGSTEQMDSPVNQAGPTLTQSQNQGRSSSLPVSQQGGTTAYSSMAGNLGRMRQNATAGGR